MKPLQKQPLRSAEIVVLGSVESLTKGIEIGNLKDQSRVGWRSFVAARAAPAKKTPSARKKSSKAATPRKKTGAKKK